MSSKHQNNNNNNRNTLKFLFNGVSESAVAIVLSIQVHQNIFYGFFWVIYEEESILK